MTVVAAKKAKRLGKAPAKKSGGYLRDRQGGSGQKKTRVLKGLLQKKEVEREGSV